MENPIEKILTQVRDGSVSIEEALVYFKKLPFEDIGFARVDHHRSLRNGFPEVIWGESKTVEQIEGILKKIEPSGQTVLVTRLQADKASSLLGLFPKGRYLEIPRLFILEQAIPQIKTKGIILVISAGTSDMPVAEEAYWTAHYMGNEVGRIYDAGVSGIHRLLAETERIQKASVIIVVAGMEGALPSVVGGIAGVPVIGVPTSVGYGASFSGITPLFTMLSSCASGITVVNIDNGFGAGYSASLINRA